MELHEKIGISKEALNRVSLWECALSQALNYLKVGSHLRSKPDSTTEHYSYNAGHRPCRLLTAFIANAGLTEAAIILFRQVFGSGNSGPGIAANRGDPQVDSLREEMVRDARTTLNWSADDYDSLFQLIRDSRHQTLAHYDGAAARYAQPAPGVESMAMVGANLLDTDRKKFEALVDAMIRFLEKKLYPEVVAQYEAAERFHEEFQRRLKSR